MLRSARNRMRFLTPGFPQPPNDLKGRVGLACARGHDQQVAVLASRDRFDGPVNGIDLVVVRFLGAGVNVVVLSDDLFFFWFETLPRAVAPPKFTRRWESI